LYKITDNLFIVEEKGHVRIYNGNYSSYRLEMEENKQQNKRSNTIEAPAVAVAKKNKLSFKEQKELETIEKEIEQVENEIKATSDDLSSPAVDNNTVIELSAKIEALNKQLDGKTFRWLELTELKEA
jgi:ATP-binding cassette subfamily F protein uup